jgi:hypothetical protein
MVRISVWTGLNKFGPNYNMDPRSVPDPRVFDLPDPDPLVRGMDPDPSTIVQKK